MIIGESAIVGSLNIKHLLRSYQLSAVSSQLFEEPLKADGR
jgi:hypothetical protein